MTSDDNIATSWSTYVNQVLGGITDLEASERVPSVSPRTFGNWRNPKKCRPPEIRRVVDFADAFGRPRPEALAAAGVELEAEITTPQPIPFEQLSDGELLRITTQASQELLRRSQGDHPPVLTKERRRRRRGFTYNTGTPPI